MAFSRRSSFLVDTWWRVCGDRVKVKQVQRWRMKNPSSIADHARRHIAEEAAASDFNAVARRNRQFRHVVRQTNSPWRPRVVIACCKVHYTELYLLANLINLNVSVFCELCCPAQCQLYFIVNIVNVFMSKKMMTWWWWLFSDIHDACGVILNNLSTLLNFTSTTTLGLVDHPRKPRGILCRSCLSVRQTITFESLNVRSSYLRIRYISREYASYSNMKVIVSRLRHRSK